MVGRFVDGVKAAGVEFFAGEVMCTYRWLYVWARQ